MERALAFRCAFLLPSVLLSPCAAIGPDPVVEDERHRVSALMIRAHNEAANNSTVAGAKRAKEENEIIPIVSGSQSLPELMKAEATLHRDIRAAESEVPNIADADAMPASIALESTDSKDALAQGPRFDGEGGAGNLARDVPGPDEREYGELDLDQAPPARAAGAAGVWTPPDKEETYADARYASLAAMPEPADDPFEGPVRRAGRYLRGPVVERGSFELELNGRMGTPVAEVLASAE